MTLCIAATAPELFPRAYRRRLRPEAGIVIVADTRFTYEDDLPAQNDVRKVGVLAPWAIAGFSGRGQVAHPALGRLGDELAGVDPSTMSPTDLALRAGTHLREFWSTYAGRRRADWPEPDTDVLIGARDTRGRFVLYALSGRTSQAPRERFVPRRRNGAVAIGSGARLFRRASRKKLHS
jgi:hypothetical protein